MRPGLITSYKLYCILSISAFIVLLSGWTCTAVVGFDSCLGVTPRPQIISLRPDTFSVDAVPVLLVVQGTGFAPQSEVLWNGKILPTTFMDSGHLEATITQQTLDSFGGSPGSTVLISVITSGSFVVSGCVNGGTSGTLILVIT